MLVSTSIAILLIMIPQLFYYKTLCSPFNLDSLEVLENSKYNPVTFHNYNSIGSFYLFLFLKDFSCFTDITRELYFETNALLL